MIIEYDEFDLTVASIPDSVLEGNASIFSTYYFYCTIISLDVYGDLPMEGSTCVCCLTYVITVN